MAFNARKAFDAALEERGEGYGYGHFDLSQLMECSMKKSYEQGFRDGVDEGKKIAADKMAEKVRKVACGEGPVNG